MPDYKSKSRLLVPVNLKNIILNENAYFYKLINRITSKEIHSFFNESLSDKNAKRNFKAIIHEPFFDGNAVVAYYSFDIFEFRRKPSFFREPEDGINELKYGFFLIVEYKDYVAIIKKYVSGAKTLDVFIEEIDYKVLAHFLVTNQSKIEKIVTNNMNTAENAIQRKVSEAVDLKGVLTRFGASKQILNSIRMDNAGKKHTVALNTSRVNSFELKNEFDQVIFWMIDTIKLIIKAYNNLPSSSFIDGFAVPLDFETTIKILQPTYLLIRFGALKDEIEIQKIERCFTKDKNGNEELVDIVAEINKNEKLFKLTKTNNDTYTSNSTSIKINEKSITISDSRLKEIFLDYGDDYIVSLNSYINTGSHFLVNFDKIDHVYANRKIFKDSKLLGDLDNFFNAFITYPELSKIDSEKGSGYLTKDEIFKPGSLFSFIENTLAIDNDVLICDDMGVEWGDFISIKKDEIAFYHAKAKSKGLSASFLEEVFGQAQKNLGMLELTNEMIELRKNRWTGTYKIDKVNTSINRIRKCPKTINKIEKIKEIVDGVSSNPNLRRKIYIVINFISKEDLKKSINELKSGNTFINNGVTLQILWFVNSLLCSANEQNTELRIICQE